MNYNGWVESLEFEEVRGGAIPRPKQEGSPYFGVPQAEHRDVTRELLRRQELDGPALLDAVLQSWDDIFESSIGLAKIGRDIFPVPQVMGFLLHELIPLRLSRTLPMWRRERVSSEKDLVHIECPELSIEIKTSSDRSKVFGNRSFGIPNAGQGKKAKSGYYCTVNFQKWIDALEGRPEITRVRYGWLDSTDWVAQVAESGQQSSLPGSVYSNQLPLLFKW